MLKLTKGWIGNLISQHTYKLIMLQIIELYKLKQIIGIYIQNTEHYR